MEESLLIDINNSLNVADLPAEDESQLIDINNPPSVTNLPTEEFRLVDVDDPPTPSVTNVPAEESQRDRNNPPKVASLPTEIRRMILEVISTQCTSRERSSFLVMNRAVYEKYLPILQLDDILLQRYTKLRHLCIWGLTKPLERYLKETGISASGCLGEPGLYPLAAAVQYGRLNCVRLLVRHGAPISGRVCLVCLFRLRQGRTRGRFDLPASCPSRYHNRHPIELIEASGNTDMAYYLLETAVERVGPGPAKRLDLHVPTTPGYGRNGPISTLDKVASRLPYDLQRRQRAIEYLRGYSVPRDSHPEIP